LDRDRLDRLLDRDRLDRLLDRDRLDRLLDRDRLDRLLDRLLDRDRILDRFVLACDRCLSILLLGIIFLNVKCTVVIRDSRIYTNNYK
jgi:hypothetical protein